jgi:hypothetical protein
MRKATARGANKEDRAARLAKAGQGHIFFNNCMLSVLH